jgi:hypothetical protein
MGQFCGEEEAEQLGDRLDAAAIAEFRQVMGGLYFPCGQG